MTEMFSISPTTELISLNDKASIHEAHIVDKNTIISPEFICSGKD